jgi:hypothetical protein
MFSFTSTSNVGSSKSTFYEKMVDAAYKITVSGMAALVLHITSILMFTAMCLN